MGHKAMARYNTVSLVSRCGCWFDSIDSKLGAAIWTHDENVEL